MTKAKKTPRQLAEEHWNWLESILNTQRRMEKELFIDAFIHGIKHGKVYEGRRPYPGIR